LIITLQTTTFSSYGGIPAYNRIVCRALNELGDSRELSQKRVLIANDGPADVKNAAKDLPSLSLEAFGRNRVALLRRTCGLALRHRVELALLGHVNYAPFGLLLRSLQPRLRYGVIAYGIDAWEKLSIAKRYALRQADFVVSISEYTKEKLIKINGLEAGSIRIIPPALECHTEDLIAAAPLTKRTNIALLSVCRFEKSERYKGIDTVIEALPNVLIQVPELRYFVIGSGSDLERHKRLAHEKGVGDHVEFLGSVDAETLRKHYRSCDLFVMPSAGEGFGIVYLEAMHYRKPVIGANSCAVPEVVRDGETGLLVEYGNSDQLATAITSLCLNSDLSARLGEAGYQRLRQNFSFDHFKRKLQEIVLNKLPVEILQGGQNGIGVADSIT
jgi:phosphatidyl-myo-inositol dimannoside synthase